MWNKTSIVCTLGPATADLRILSRLIEAGLDVVRLNFSHGTLEGHRKAVRLVREAAARCGRSVGILQDLPGPKMRTGRLPGGKLEISRGEEVLLSPRPAGALKHLPFSDLRVLRALGTGDDIFLSDGIARLKVLRAKDGAVLCRVLSGATLRSEAGVNIPGVDLPVAAFTRRDRLYLEFGLAEGVDFVAVSFVGRPEDLKAVRRAMAGARRKPLVVAKIERGPVLERLPEIVREADAVMVARGDLGVELPCEKVPFAQKRIIAECRRQGRPAIVATQMLESMVENPRPTRAELTDIANAVLDGADAVMLSGETAVGKHPLEAVKTLAAVATEAEVRIRPEISSAYPYASAETRSAAAAAVALAEGVGARAIVAPSFTGETVRCLSQLRPSCPVLALAGPEAQGSLTLLYGVRAAALRPGELGFERLLGAARSAALRMRIARKGEPLVVAGRLDRGRRGERIVAQIKA